MSGYRSVHKGTIEFDGQQVGYELKRITVEQSLESRGLDGVGMAAFVRKYLVRLDDIPDADGQTVPLDTVFTDFYFVKLVGELGQRLVETGKIPKAKLDPSAGNSSAASLGELSRQ